MHVRLIAVSDRQPAWVDDAFFDYQGRLPRNWRFRSQVQGIGMRGKSSAAGAAVAAEGDKILAALKPAEFVVLLDERGKELGSRAFSACLSSWMGDGRDLCFVIGGPDGVSGAIRERADFCWSLSKMTLPHGLARVMFIEQLYRAWTLTQGHPYHRD